MTNFEKACKMSFNDWAAAIPDIVPEAEYTAKHEKWLKTLFNKMRNNRYHTLTSRKFKLLLTAAVIATLLLTAFAIPSSRESVIEKFDTFTTYKLTKSNNNSLNGNIIVGYIPYGFELVGEHELNKQIILEYESNSGENFVIYKCSSSTEINFDTENSEVEMINGEKNIYYYCLGQNNYSNIVWTENDYIYRIDGNLSKGEFINIAESVE